MLKLIKMTQEYFDDYLSTAIETYANEKVDNGIWDKTDALLKSQEQYDLLLPNGLYTPSHYFYSIYNKNVNVGYIWIAKSTDSQTTAFIYDFEIYSKFQNMGFGTQAIELIGLEGKNLGFSSLALHVFGNSTGAIHVYEKSGFKITDMNMRKDI